MQEGLSALLTLATSPARVSDSLNSESQESVFSEGVDVRPRDLIPREFPELGVGPMVLGSAPRLAPPIPSFGSSTRRKPGAIPAPEHKLKGRASYDASAKRFVADVLARYPPGRSSTFNEFKVAMEHYRSKRCSKFMLEARMKQIFSSDDEFLETFGRFYVKSLENEAALEARSEEIKSRVSPIVQSITGRPRALSSPEPSPGGSAFGSPMNKGESRQGLATNFGGGPPCHFHALSRVFGDRVSLAPFETWRRDDHLSTSGTFRSSQISQ